MCAIGLTDSPSRYVIINEPRETDPFTRTHSYWPPSLPPPRPPSFLHAIPPSIPSTLFVCSDRVHPGMVNKSLRRTTTSICGVMGFDDLLFLSPPLFLSRSFSVSAPPGVPSNYSTWKILNVSLPETDSLSSQHRHVLL